MVNSQIYGGGSLKFVQFEHFKRRKKRNFVMVLSIQNQHKADRTTYYKAKKNLYGYDEMKSTKKIHIENNLLRQSSTLRKAKFFFTYTKSP